MSIRLVKNYASIVLVNYAGYPSSPNSLMPDNGLAALAGGLKAAGHKVRIIDYATVSTVKRLVPHILQKRLASVLKTFEEIPSGRSLSKREKAKQAAAFLELQVLAKGLEAVRWIEERKITGEIIRTVREQDADMVGFKLWNGDGFTGPVRMAAELKRSLPNLRIVAGGPQVKFSGGRMFDFTRVFDALAVGDGEATIVPLAETVLGRDLSEVPNIFYLRDGKPVATLRVSVPKMDGLPFPLYDPGTYPAMIGDEKIMIFVVEDRRGCENLCRYCVHPVISGDTPRSKSPQRVADEFQRIMWEYNASSFRLGGSSSPSKLLLGLAQELDRRKMRVNWTAFARIKDSRPEDFPYLAKNGLYGLFFGIESGSQNVLDRMNKQVTVGEIRATILASKAAGIFTVGSVIYPAPFDTPETRAQTFELLREIRPDSVPLQFMGVYPGTEYALHPEKYNLEIVYPSWFSNLLVRAGLKEKPEYSDPEVMRYIMQYKLQLLFPPKYWPALPWKINGMDHKQFASETQALYEDLKKIGVLCMLTDEEALMAHLGGYTPEQFAREAFTNSFTGDGEAMAEMVRKINRNI
jgi:radical SAM superfamily enzyme YgiQ (UPF0313 family)